MPKRIPYLRTEHLENHILSGCTYLNSENMGVLHGYAHVLSKSVLPISEKILRGSATIMDISTVVSACIGSFLFLHCAI